MKTTSSHSNISSFQEISENISLAGTDINTDMVANEVLDWIIANVEQFIDNQAKMFKIDLIIDGESNPPMPETRKLQDLFRHIPEDEDMIKASDIFKKNGTINMKKFTNKNIDQAAKTRGWLDKITQECLVKMQGKEEKLKKLYERMSFYYEMIGFHKGNPLLRELSGAVNITKFEYEAFTVDVKVASPVYQIKKENGTTDNIESQTKEYKIEESFTVWVEIAFTPKMVATSIF